MYPRLRRAAPATLAAAAEGMVRQHAGIDALVAEMLLLWAEVQREPRKLSDVAAAIAERSRRLQELWDTHLELEERKVFPAMQQFLSPQELEAVREEMQRRRAG